MIEEEKNLIEMQKKCDKDIILIQKKKEAAETDHEEYILLNSRVQELKRNEDLTISRIQVMKDKIQTLQEVRAQKKAGR